MATANLPDFSRRGSQALSESVEDLLELRARIDAQLPDMTLRSVNIEQELVIQLLLVQKLQRDVHADESTPASSKAQCANSVASALVSLAKLQESIHNSERLKNIETILIECLQALPTDTQEAFFQLYETRLNSI